MMMPETGRARGPGSEELVLSAGDGGGVCRATCVSAEAGRGASAEALRAGGRGARATAHESRLAASPSRPGGSVAETPADGRSWLPESSPGRFLPHRLARSPRRLERGPWRPAAFTRCPAMLVGGGWWRGHRCVPGFRVCVSDLITNRYIFLNFYVTRNWILPITFSSP